MNRARKPAADRKTPGHASTVFQQQWFFEMLPSPINGEIRLRMRRPSSWICVAEAATLIACGIQTVHNLCDDGQLEWRWLDHQGSGGKKLVLVDSVQTYLTKKRQLPTHHPGSRQVRHR
jgi:hypothetical protein